MELFTVNRYDNKAVVDDPDKEQKILEKLQKSIKKRKRKLEEAEAISNEPNEITEKPFKDENASPDESTKENEKSPTNGATEVDPALTTNPFRVLGDDRITKRQTVQAILPPWLAYPTIISGDLTSKTESIENVSFLSNDLKSILRTMSIDHLFPVQSTVIPWILNAHNKPLPFRPRDVCVSAPTGSGKTLAYAVPIVELLKTRMERKIQALIVLPVNELAVQVLKVFKKLCEATNLNCILLSKAVPFEKEQLQLVEEFNGNPYSKVDIVIATTGRLVQHLHSTKGFCLKSLKFLIMDEADRIMEQIHNNWLYHLDSHVKQKSDSFLSAQSSMALCYRELCEKACKQPHKLLFSATLSQDPEKLKNLNLFQPKLFTSVVNQFEAPVNGERAANSTDAKDVRGEFIGKFTTPAELTEKYCLTQVELKPLTLYSLIVENHWNRFLCFTNSGESAHRLSYILQHLLGKSMKIEELSSGLLPTTRASVLQKFQAGKIDGLICSDALARGIDIQGVDIVISYDAPRHIKTYIHRIGRTARAGQSGLAVTILTKHDQSAFNNFVKEGGKQYLEEITIDSKSEELKAKDYANAVQHMQNALKREQHNQMARSVNSKKNRNIDTAEGGGGDVAGGGFIEQLQSKVQATTLTAYRQNQMNVPESWKWENQQQTKSRKERKNKKKPNKNQTPQN